MNPMRSLQFGEKAFGGPAVAQEEKFQASAFAMLAQDLGIAEELGNALDDRHNLIPADESVQPSAEIRFGRKSAGHAQREANFAACRRYGA